jgi:hypothetical protein
MKRGALGLNRRGIALLLTLLLALLVVSLAIGVLLMMTSTTLVTRFHLAESAMSNLAAAGLEQARDTLNGSPNLVPQPTGFVTLEDNVVLRDANNTVIPGLTRSTYAGLTGGATGEAGLYTSVLSVISNFRGPVVIRRADYKQRSFAAYERFYRAWSSGSWNANDAVFGPVHSNQEIRLSGGSPGTRFWARVTSVGAISNASNGTFYSGYQTGAAAIPYPTSSAIADLQPIAQSGGLVIVGDGRLSVDDPMVRVEFVAIDLNGDGDTRDENEGFVRVFRAVNSNSVNLAYVNAFRWGGLSGWPFADNSSDPNMLSPNCGGWTTPGADTSWTSAGQIQTNMQAAARPLSFQRDSIRGILTSSSRSCHLGGDRAMTGNLWNQSIPGRGSWDVWPGWGGTPPAALVNAIATQGVDPTTDANTVAQTFWPISGSFNPASRGVIYVTGSVTVSGKVRARVTLAARGNIMIGDDIVYVQAPNTTCADILGLVSQTNIIMQDNNVNTPFRVGNTTTGGFDDTGDEIIHGFLLALNAVTGDNMGSGEPSILGEECGGAYLSSRGCRFLVGGIAQADYYTTYNGSTGWHDQDHFDQCGALMPPPYYPTTGSFTKYRYYEIDPVGFTPAGWFAANQ